MSDVVASTETAAWMLIPKGSRLRRQAEVTEEDLGDDGVDTARILVSVFASSADWFVLKILGLFEAGVKIGDAEEELRVRFSIVGSMAFSISSVATTTFVVRPIPENPEAAATPAEELRAALEEAIQAAIAEHSTDSTFVARPRVRIVPKSVESRLFADKVFHEFRFGIEHEAWEESAHTLTRIAREFSTFLGERDTPIAYMSFPVKWPAPSPSPLDQVDVEADGIRWLNIAVGLPAGFVEPVELQLEAYRLARDNGAALALYNASSSSAYMGQRFELVYLPPSLIAAGEPAQPFEELEANAVEHVFFEEEAREGLIGSALSCGDGHDFFLYGGTMTVVQGRTVAAFVLPKDDSHSFVAELGKVFGTSEASEVVERISDLAATMDPQMPASSASSRTPVWIAWRAPDEVGVLARVLELIVRTTERMRGVDVREAADVFAQSLHLESFSSRVLADGSTCAGKIKLAVESGLATQMLDGCEALESELARMIIPDSSTWSPAHGNWRDQPVIVAAEEPAEEPWARLTLEVG